MSQNKLTISHLYTPENQTKEELIDNFVIRNKEFKRIYKDIKSTPLDESPQNFLIEGQRGTGKTSLMLRIRYEIENELKKKNNNKILLPVQLPEEQYGVFDLCRLWEHIADYLHEESGFETLADELDKQAEYKDYPSSCFNTLDDFLVKNNKRLILFLDNFGDMLNKFTDIEQKRLRDIFHTSKHIHLIAASAQTLEATYKHDQPFFEFFKIIRLKNLTPKEATALLQQLATRYDAEDAIEKIIKEEPERIETIRILTGGVPRTIALLFEVFLDKNAKIFEDLESLLDRVTPLYKHRMDDLKRNQQAIMNVIALNWDGIATAEIVERLKGRGFDNKKVAAQLKALEQNGLVSSKKVDKKNKIYFIRERFFNIWYLMRYGRKKNKMQVLWLVRFLQEWCNQDELIHRAKRHIEAAKAGLLHAKGGIYMTEALAPLVNDIELQHELINTTRNALRPMLGDIDRKISKSDKEIYQLAYKEIKNKNFKLAIKYYKELIKKGYIEPSRRIALIYELEYKNFNLAIDNYKEAIKNNSTEAMYNLAQLYDNKLKEFNQAIVDYKMAIRKGNKEAMYNLAHLYHIELKDTDHAISYYKMAAKKDERKAMNNLAFLYYIQAIEKEAALTLSKTSYLSKKDSIIAQTLAVIQLWNNRYQESINTIKEFLASPDDIQKYIDDITDYFLLLLAKKQHQAAYDLFQEFPDLKQQFKPVYYALMTLLKKQYPKEYLKMGSELEETVQEILKKIEEKAIRYA